MEVVARALMLRTLLPRTSRRKTGQELELATEGKREFDAQPGGDDGDEELDRKLDEFEGLVLSPQDDGFLRLARLVLQSPPSPPPKRDDGLIS